MAALGHHSYLNDIYIYEYKVQINRITNIQPKPLENWKILANFDLMILGLQCNFHNSMES